MIFFMINPFFLFYFTLALEQPGERVCFAIKHVVFGGFHLDIFPAWEPICLNRNGKQNHIDPHVYSPPVFLDSFVKIPLPALTIIMNSSFSVPSRFRTKNRRFALRFPKGHTCPSDFLCFESVKSRRASFSAAVYLYTYEYYIRVECLNHRPNLPYELVRFDLNHLS